MGELILQSLLALGLYGLFVLVFTLLGAYSNINIWNMKWDWRKWVNGLAKWLIIGFSVLATVVGVSVLATQAKQWGVEIPQAQAVSAKAIFAVLVAGCLVMVAKIMQKLAAIFGVSPEQLKTIQEKAVVSGDEAVAVEVADLPKPPKDYLKKKLDAEQIGGLGAVYAVPTGSFDQFRSAVLGRGYDIDGAYSYQCWDGAALLWQQFGQQLITGNGAARGCWELNRGRNAHPHFEQIFDRSQVRRGDVVFFGGSRWGHVAFADENYKGGATLSCLGQNQRGNGNGHVFTVDNISMANFLGAMRLKKWVAAPAPQPVPAAPKPHRAAAEAVDAVIAGKYGNGDERRQRLVADGYNADEVQRLVNERLAAQTPAPQPATPQIAVGDRVVPTSLVDYNGTPLTQYDDKYEVAEVVGDRVVLVARGQVWAAMNINHLRRV